MRESQYQCGDPETEGPGAVGLRVGSLLQESQF